MSILTALGEHVITNVLDNFIQAPKSLGDAVRRYAAGLVDRRLQADADGEDAATREPSSSSAPPA